MKQYQQNVKKNTTNWILIKGKSVFWSRYASVIFIQMLIATLLILYVQEFIFVTNASYVLEAVTIAFIL